MIKNKTKKLTHVILIYCLQIATMSGTVSVLPDLTENKQKMWLHFLSVEVEGKKKKRI